MKFHHSEPVTKGEFHLTINEAGLQEFYTAGYTEGNLVEMVMVIGDKVITNDLHALTEVPVDWPLAPVL